MTCIIMAGEGLFYAAMIASEIDARGLGGSVGHLYP